MICEAHLPARKRSAALVRYLPGKRRSISGWAILIGLVALNEMRGLYMVAEFLKALAQA